MRLQVNRKEFKRYINIILPLLLFASIIFIIFLLRHVLRALAVIGLFILADVLISRVKRVFSAVSIQIEVITLGTIICSILWGFGAGAFMAVLASLIGDAVAKRMSVYTFVRLGSYIIMAAIATAFDPANVVKAGIILAIANNLTLFLVFRLAFRYNMLKNISYTVSNIAFNILLFNFAAGAIIGFLA